MNEKKKKQRTKHKKVDLNNLFVNTPEQDIPESLRKSVFLDAKKDPAFKRLFGDARLVCNFLNAVLHLDGSDQIQKVEILDKDVALVQASDEIFSVDIRARNGKKQYFDIEIQGRGHGAFFDRAVLYAGIVAAEAHSEALHDYDKAKKNLGKTARYKMPHIICIWICNFPKKKNKVYFHQVTESGGMQENHPPRRIRLVRFDCEFRTTSGNSRYGKRIHPGCIRAIASTPHPERDTRKAGKRHDSKRND